MNLKASSSSLSEALAAVSPACAGRTTKPILSHVMLRVDGDTLTLESTDLEVSIRTSISGLTDAKPGGATIDPVKLTAILGGDADGEVSLAVTDAAVTVRTANGKFVLNGYPADDFPTMPDSSLGDRFNVEGLANLIKRTIFAADKKESGARWAVTGVLFEIKDGTLRLVATDTKRLAMNTYEQKIDAADAAVLVPRKTCEMVRSLAAGSVGIEIGKTEIRFIIGDTVISSRLVEGRFPPYRDIIPKKTSVKATLNREAFLSAVRQAAIMVDESSQRVDFNFAGGKVVLSAEGSELGSSEVSCAVEITGPLNVAFDPHYITELMKACDHVDGVTMEANDGEKPVMFHAGEGGSFLVMPLAG